MIIYPYIYTYIHTHGEQFGYSSECKTHNCFPHRPLSVLINRLQPPHHTPPVKLKWVQFRSMQTGLVNCRRNLNRPRQGCVHCAHVVKPMPFNHNLESIDTSFGVSYLCPVNVVTVSCCIIIFQKLLSLLSYRIHIHPF